MQFIDDAEFQIAIDDDNGGRIVSPSGAITSSRFHFADKSIHRVGAMAPGLDVLMRFNCNPAGESFQLPTTIDPPHAIHGFGVISSWQEIGPGRSLLHLPAPYNGATVAQSIEVLDDAIRWNRIRANG